MRSPQNYKTLRGLLQATEQVLKLCNAGSVRVSGMSGGMWVQNAEWVAKTLFKDTDGIAQLRQRYAVTRPEDLRGGHAVFGFPLPRRDYIIGDVVPGVGRIDEILGDQIHIEGQWFHKRCFTSSSR